MKKFEAWVLKLRSKNKIRTKAKKFVDPLIAAVALGACAQDLLTDMDETVANLLQFKARVDKTHMNQPNFLMNIFVDTRPQILSCPDQLMASTRIRSLL